MRNDPRAISRPVEVDDDAPVGRILTRREILALLGAVGVTAACAPGVLTAATPTTAASVAAGTAAPGASAAATTGAAVATPSCIVRPALTEGPYFVDEKLNRSDIRSEPTTGALKPGLALVLTFNVARVSSAPSSPRT